MLEYVDRSYLRDDDFARTLYLSQLMQAEGMKTAMEAHRRNMPYCMGRSSGSSTTYGPAPAGRESTIAAGGKPCTTCGRVRTGRRLLTSKAISTFSSSPTCEAAPGSNELTLTDFSGNELKSSSHPVTVGAAASQRALRYGVRDYLDGADPGNAVLVCEFRSDKTAYRALQYFETMKNAALRPRSVSAPRSPTHDLPDYGEQRQTGEESHPALQGYGGNLLRQLFRPAAGRKPERHAYGAGRCRRDPATHRMYGTQS